MGQEPPGRSGLRRRGLGTRRRIPAGNGGVCFGDEETRQQINSCTSVLGTVSGGSGLRGLTRAFSFLQSVNMQCLYILGLYMYIEDHISIIYK